VWVLSQKNLVIKDIKARNKDTAEAIKKKNNPMK
jgi:hypothetical protein